MSKQKIEFETIAPKPAFAANWNRAFLQTETAQKGGKYSAVNLSYLPQRFQAWETSTWTETDIQITKGHVFQPFKGSLSLRLHQTFFFPER